MATLKELSKQSFTPSDTSFEGINAGSLQRIADATEIMTKNYVQMQNDLKWYSEKYRERNAQIEKLKKQISSYKGVITKLKRSVK